MSPGGANQTEWRLPLKTLVGSLGLGFRKAPCMLQETLLGATFFIDLFNQLKPDIGLNVPSFSSFTSCGLANFYEAFSSEMTACSKLHSPHWRSSMSR